MLQIVKLIEIINMKLICLIFRISFEAVGVKVKLIHIKRAKKDVQGGVFS